MLQKGRRAMGKVGPKRIFGETGDAASEYGPAVSLLGR